MSPDKLTSSLQDAHAVGGGAMGVALHLTRILANRGLISPNEVETLFAALMIPFDDMASEELRANTTENLGSMMAEIRLFARERWIGKDGAGP